MIRGIFGKKILGKIMKIYVLGSKGMLGRYVTKYLKNKYNVIGLARKDIDASSVNEESLHAKLHHLGIKENDVVINCVGTIKPQIDALGDLNGIQVNSVFPRFLANVCEKINVKLIHPTTDCVFTGLKGKYNEKDIHDISDVYGRTKSLGEPNNCTVIRTSIIGEEVGQGRSLVEWIKSSSNTTVFGFTNHYWNGVTCLEFAKICEKIIETNGYWTGVRHIHSNTLNKKELVELISDVYGLNVTVTPKETPIMCDRSILSIYDTVENMSIPTLKNQIQEMKIFSEKLYSND
jgi:dTDP-4-dehydrorhamnose reductase